MSDFYPALAHTDNIAYFDSENNRKMMSIRNLMPPEMGKQFLTSLSFDEKIHYAHPPDIDFFSINKNKHNTEISKVFVDCGAFHYSKFRTPKFSKGGFVNAYTAFDQYDKRHLKRNPNVDFLLCSPDHIVPPNADNDTYSRRHNFTLTSAEIFFDLCKENSKISPVGVVHGRTMQERADATSDLINLGFEYIAFGGLVPLARNTSEILFQLTGCNDKLNMKITETSALGIAKMAGVKTHLFGLNSPDWYRWAKRLGIDSFDGSKMSNEGAANGIIWIENDIPKDEVPSNASKLFKRMSIKKINERNTIKKAGISYFKFSKNGQLKFDNIAWDFLMSSRCTSPKCPHGPEIHISDPRVTGSTEHNMGRTILNSWTFNSIMKKIDEICENAQNSDDSNLKQNWSQIEVF